MIDPKVKKYLDVAIIGKSHKGGWHELKGAGSCSHKYEISPNGLIRNKQTGRILRVSKRGRSDGYWVSLRDNDGYVHGFNFAYLLASTFIANPNKYRMAKVIDPDIGTPFDITNIGWFPDIAFPRMPSHKLSDPTIRGRIITLIEGGLSIPDAVHAIWPKIYGEEYRRHYQYAYKVYRSISKEES